MMLSFFNGPQYTRDISWAMRIEDVLKELRKQITIGHFSGSATQHPARPAARLQ
jgi:hypothetical protein